VAVEKRVFFRSRWLPWALLAPQAFVIVAFFFWPAGQALLQSFQQSDAFGTSVDWVGLENFENLWNDETYLASFKTTAVFSILVATIGLTVSLMLAVFADRVIKGAAVYKTLLIWPYAVAPAVAGVLWLFLFAPGMGIVAYALGRMGFEWNHLLNGTHAMTLVVLAAVWKQISYNFLFFLAGLQSIPKSLIEAAAIDGASPWRRFWTIVFPLLSPTTFFLLVINPRWPGQGHGDPGLQGVLRRLQGPGPRRLGGAVGRADGDRDCAHRRAVPLRREESELLRWLSANPCSPLCRTWCCSSAC
jgi:sn-glycerol 3-phosphate transport system permease protein